MSSFGKIDRSEMIFNLNSFILATIITNTLAEYQPHRNLRCHLVFFSTVIIIELRDQDQTGASRCSWERRWRTGRRRGRGLKMLQASRALIFLTIKCIARASLIFRNHIKSRALCSDSYRPELKIAPPLPCAQMHIVPKWILCGFHIMINCSDIVLTSATRSITTLATSSR